MNSSPRASTIIFISHKLDEVLGDLRRDHGHPRWHARSTTVAARRLSTARQLAELMVGSELPDPRDARTGTEESVEPIEVLVELDAEAAATTSTAAAATKPRRWTAASQSFDTAVDGIVDHAVHTTARCVGVAGVEGNGQTELRRSDHRAAPRLDSGTIDARRSATSPATQRARPPRGGHRLHPRRPPSRGPASSPRRSGRTRFSGTRRDARLRPRVRFDLPAPVRDVTHEQIIDRLRRAHTRHRGPGVRPVRRQPAEARRRSRDARRARTCSWPHTPLAASTSEPKPRSGTSCATPAAEGMGVAARSPPTSTN